MKLVKSNLKSVGMKSAWMIAAVIAVGLAQNVEAKNIKGPVVTEQSSFGAALSGHRVNETEARRDVEERSAAGNVVRSSSADAGSLALQMNEVSEGQCAPPSFASGQIMGTTDYFEALAENAEDSFFTAWGNVSQSLGEAFQEVRKGDTQLAKGFVVLENAMKKVVGSFVAAKKAGFRAGMSLAAAIGLIQSDPQLHIQFAAAMAAEVGAEVVAACGV